VEDEERLQEVKASAMLWREYWESSSHAGKENSTKRMLEATLSDDFDWDTILSWDLRA
jgi:hypothetical protein